MISVDPAAMWLERFQYRIDRYGSLAQEGKLREVGKHSGHKNDSSQICRLCFLLGTVLGAVQSHLISSHNNPGGGVHY